MHGRGPGVSLAELGSLSVFVDHVSEESMTPVGVSSRVTVVGPWGGGWCRGLSASRVEVRTTTVGISPGAGARDDRAGVILVCLSEPGAGAKQEQRLFRDLPELLSTAADGPAVGKGFSIFAGQRIVEITWGSSDRITSGQGVAVPAPGRCDHALVTQSTGTRAAVGPYPGFRVSFRFRLVGIRGAAAGDHEGEPRPHWPWTFWLDTVMSLSVGLECVVLIFMAGQRLT
jgi:hypothetical protein